MRIILASSFVPHVHGGARFIVEWTEAKLKAAGHEVERFYLPFVEDPAELLQQMAAYRLMDLTSACDRLIAIRPPAHVLRHPNKVLWFIHHIRAYYDLWGHPFGYDPAKPQDCAMRDAVRRFDDVGLSEALRVYSNSQAVSDRLTRFNGVASTPLYPPLFEPRRYVNLGYGEEVVLVSRVEPHKRQELAVRALAMTRSPVRLRLCGAASSPAYAADIHRLAVKLGVSDRLAFEDRWVDEAEKAELVGRALAVAYLPHDEDSYGYPSLEAAHAEKGVITTTDAGGVLELVRDGVNGLVADPQPESLAQAFDRLYDDRALATRLGRGNAGRVMDLRIEWDRVVEALTG